MYVTANRSGFKTKRATYRHLCLKNLQVRRQMTAVKEFCSGPVLKRFHICRARFDHTVPVRAVDWIQVSPMIGEAVSFLIPKLAPPARFNALAVNHEVDMRLCTEASVRPGHVQPQG